MYRDVALPEHGTLFTQDTAKTNERLRGKGDAGCGGAVHGVDMSFKRSEV
jgi:hypothetical protein